MKNAPQNGFTMLELLATVAIVAIVATIGFPALSEMVKANRLSSAVNDFIASATLARSEAIKRRMPVTICISATPTAADPDCDGNEWESGWVVFADANGNAAIDPGDTIVQQFGPLHEDVEIRADDELATFLSFSREGRTRDAAEAPVTGALVFCDDRGITDTGGGVSTARAVNLAPTGHARSLKKQTLVAGTGISCP